MSKDYPNCFKRFVDEGYIGETWYEFINRVLKPEIEKKVKLATIKDYRDFIRDIIDDIKDPTICRQDIIFKIALKNKELLGEGE